MFRYSWSDARGPSSEGAAARANRAGRAAGAAFWVPSFSVLAARAGAGVAFCVLSLCVPAARAGAGAGAAFWLPPARVVLLLLVLPAVRAGSADFCVPEVRGGGATF